jgi:hypothetical protein
MKSSRYAGQPLFSLVLRIMELTALAACLPVIDRLFALLKYTSLPARRSRVGIVDGHM